MTRRSWRAGEGELQARPAETGKWPRRDLDGRRASSYGPHQGGGNDARDKDRIFTNLYGLARLGPGGARARGAWDGTKALIDKGRDWIVDEVKTSDLRGRGGAGFPTGLKWSFMPKESDGRPHYLVVNADESEPGTCKDREIMRHDPHLLVEGCLIAAFAMGAHVGYIYIRGEFIREREHLQAAIDEAYDGQADRQGQRPRLGFRHLRPSRRRRLYLRRGDRAARKPRRQEGPAAPEAAVPGQCRSLRLPDDGQQRRDRSRSCRTSCAAARAWFAGIGRPNNTGTKLFCISGHVEKPCNVEEAMGIPLARTDRDACRRRPRRLGQPAGGHSRRLVDAADPGEQICDDLLMDFDGCRELKSALGTAAVIVMDKSTDIIRAIARISYFYKHESCGQCTPCREGTGWMWRVLTRMAEGRAHKREIDMLLEVTTAGRRPHHLRARATPRPGRSRA